MKHTPSKKHLVILRDKASKIIRIESLKNYTRFVMINGKTEMMAYCLKEYQNYFSFPFVRINRSCIVNLHYFTNIYTLEKKVVLTDGSEVQISRRRLENVIQQIEKLS